MRIIQIEHPDHGRRVARVEGYHLNLIDDEWPSAYDLFGKIINEKLNPDTFIPTVLTGKKLSYDTIYQGKESWKILPPFDHPASPTLCMLSGTGLTHKASADNRQKMHQELSESRQITDSMKIYLLGEEKGKPGSGNIGVQPEWFYKGNGTNLKACGDALVVPPYGIDGGEESEIAGIYMISEEGIPYRVGFTTANEFSDHVMEKKNYLYLAPSKLRNCAAGPELVLNGDFTDVTGSVTITRNENVIWHQKIKSGEQNMCHSLENLEHHHFKYDQHRLPGMVHIHFFGADKFTFGAGIQLKDRDQMSVEFDGYGRPLVNTISISSQKERLIKTESLYNGK